METWRAYFRRRFYWCGANNSPWFKCPICLALMVACAVIVFAGGLGLMALVKHG